MAGDQVRVRFFQILFRLNLIAGYFLLPGRKNKARQKALLQN